MLADLAGDSLESTEGTWNLGLGMLAVVAHDSASSVIRSLEGRGVPAWVAGRVVVDAAHLARYAEVCGFAPSAQAPLTYPQMLTFPLVMAYMTSSACPWPAMGTVHLANAITQHAPLAAGDAVRVELSSPVAPRVSLPASVLVRAEPGAPEDRGQVWVVDENAAVVLAAFALIAFLCRQ